MSVRITLLFLVVVFAASGAYHAGPGWQFTDVTAAAGVNHDHGYVGPITSERWYVAGGVAAGDCTGDGWPDLYLVSGNIAPNVLLVNRRNGAFLEQGATFGVDSGPDLSSGPIFTDIDGDGWLDLLMGGFEGTPPHVFRNRGDGGFDDISTASGLDNGNNDFSYAFGDIDGDGDLDLAKAHWTSTQNFESGSTEGLQYERLSLWTNDGSGTFTNVTATAGLAGNIIFAFTPNFTDLNNDGWLDLLVAADFGTSVYFLNDGDGTFTKVVDAVISDENGMGAAINDYDGDGLLDWFVSSIWDPNGIPEANWGVTGNRLYRNLGNGTFEDATDAAGVREGYWGWGSCFADFNNDGWVDLFHVNGFVHASASEFHNDPARMFVNNGDGTFTEMSNSLGVDHTGQGRGVACFDYDRDGDLDIFIANNGEPSKLYRNDGGNAGNFLTVKLYGGPPNTEAIGARVTVTTGSFQQLREIRSGSNYVSSDPALAHFGLGSATTVDELRVDWPDGGTTVYEDLPVNQFLQVSELTINAPPAVPAGAGMQRPMRVDKLDPTGNTLEIDWDESACLQADGYQLVWGTGSQFPASPGGVLGLSGAACDVGAPPPITWSGVPDPAADPSRLVWWVVVAEDGATTEGSWGRDSGGLERVGPAPGGASGHCGITAKDLSNACGR